MKAEIISIGTELTSGQNLDTNSRWISQRLLEVGIPVGFHTTVDDDLAANDAAFRTAVGRAPLVIATGGLGPTADDLTREVLARLADAPLVQDDASLQTIEAMFTRRQRPMPERNKVQALFPQGSTPIPNANGTAPGIWITIGSTVVVALPGVPREMVPMLTDWVLPRLQEKFGAGKVIRTRIIRTFGGGESHIEEKLGDLIRRGRQPLVGITASEATISLRITATANTVDEAEAAIAQDVAFIQQTLGDLVFGQDDDELQEAIGRLLREQELTVATAESCTGGLVGHLITEVAGSSQYYLGGVVTYSNEAKQELLQVPTTLLAEHGAVSPAVAEWLAASVRRRFGADLGIGVTGIAGPGGGSEKKPVGLVYVALAHGNGVEVGKYNWPADRSAIKLRSAKTALNLLRKHLLDRQRSTATE